MKTALATFTGIFQTKTKPVPFFVPRAHHYPTGLLMITRLPDNGFYRISKIMLQFMTKQLPLQQRPTTLYASDDYWSFSNGCNVSVSLTDTWADTSMQYASYDVTVSNTSSSDVTNWRFRITWNEEISPKEYWSCEIGGSGNNRLFIPVDYNTTIPAGSYITFGMIVYGVQSPELTNITFE